MSVKTNLHTPQPHSQDDYFSATRCIFKMKCAVFLSKSFKALQVKLFDLCGSKTNTMGGLFQAPVQAQSHYIFIVSTFKSPTAVVSTMAYGDISQTHGNQHVMQTRLLHEPESADLQKMKSHQVTGGLSCYRPVPLHLKHNT